MIWIRIPVVAIAFAAPLHACRAVVKVNRLGHWPAEVTETIFQPAQARCGWSCQLHPSVVFDNKQLIGQPK